MILDKITERIRAGLPALKAARPIDAAALEPSKRSFLDALSGKAPVALIAEVKKASPSRGRFDLPLPPVELALAYQKAGANAVSVVTERNFFLGDPADLAAISAKVGIPVLRKDFIVDEYQILEARLLGADAVLLIAAILSADEADRFIALAESLGMDCLLEVHSRAEYEKVADTGARIIGINNRNLQDFSLTLETTRELAPEAGRGRVLVSESGIWTHADVAFVRDCGAQAVLVGESIIKSKAPDRAIAELLGRGKA